MPPPDSPLLDSPRISAASAAPPPSGRLLDRFGVLVSGLCLVHCISGLVLVTLLGIGGGVLLDPAIHEIGLAVAVGVGAVGLGLGVLRHRRFALVAVGGCGLTLMASALLVRHGPREAVLTMLGVSLVAAAHILNMRAAHPA
ncbi:MAG: MerC domain-containing protein [Sphingomonadales bacterium]|nr:MerC domain-containing protein [Sphingomonadales bacterium]